LATTAQGVIVNFLITGVAGFIGSHLAEELIARGHKVIGVDNLFSGHLENIQHLDSNFSFYKVDATDYEQMNGIISSLEQKPDAYINMAAACLLYSLDNPKEGFDIEIKLCQTMCELSRNKKVNRIVQFSTSEVYGGNKNGKPFDLNSACFPKTTYAAGKLAADNFLKVYREKFGLNAFFIRPFNNFGERQENAIIPKTIQKLIGGETPIVYGSGQQTRDFMYVKDTVKIVANILESGDNKDVLLSTGKKCTMNKIINLIANKMQYNGIIKRLDSRDLDVDQLVGKKYKYEYTTFDVALNNTINWHKSGGII